MSRHGGTNGARLSRRVSKGAAAVSGAAPGSSIGGFPTIWAQNIADQRVNLDLRLLRQFLVVCDSPSLTAAAAKLGLSTPAISQLIMRLERDLDISLLERSNHGTRLTPAGAAMRDHARSMLEYSDNVLKEMREYHAKPLPRLRVFVLSSVAGVIMPVLLDSLRNSVGELQLQSGFGDHLSRDFLQGEIDILISTDRIDGVPRIQCLPLCGERLIAVAPAGLGPEMMSVSALSDQLPFVRCTKASPLAGMVEDYLAGQSLAPPHRIECNVTSSMLEMVKTGLAWTILPPLCISHTAIEASTMSFFELPAPVKTRSIHVISATDALLDLPQRIAKEARQALSRLTSSWRTQDGCSTLADAVSVEPARMQGPARRAGDASAALRKQGQLPAA